MKYAIWLPEKKRFFFGFGKAPASAQGSRESAEKKAAFLRDVEDLQCVVVPWDEQAQRIYSGGA